jgi:hypothetical protein
VDKVGRNFFGILKPYLHWRGLYVKTPAISFSLLTLANINNPIFVASPKEAKTSKISVAVARVIAVIIA